ncbi:MAG: hypothetical protein MHPSP_001918, partial [Paramarteilia canceri]
KRMKNYVRKSEKANPKAVLIAAYESAGNWSSLVPRPYISMGTSYQWLDPSKDGPDKHAGYRGEIIKENHLLLQTNIVNNNPTMTLQEIRD